MNHSWAKSRLRYLMVFFRYACLAAVLAAAALIFLDFFWQQRAWEAAFKFAGRIYSGGHIEAGLMYSALWLVTAIVQIISIQRASFGMDIYRTISLIAASRSIRSSWPEMWSWYNSANGSFGEPLPRTTAWGGVDIVLSLPVLFLSLFVFFLFSRKEALLPGR